MGLERQTVKYVFNIWLIWSIFLYDKAVNGSKNDNFIRIFKLNLNQPIKE